MKKKKSNGWAPAPLLNYHRGYLHVHVNQDFKATKSLNTDQLVRKWVLPPRVVTVCFAEHFGPRIGPPKITEF